MSFLFRFFRKNEIFQKNKNKALQKKEIRVKETRSQRRAVEQVSLCFQSKEKRHSK